MLGDDLAVIFDTGMGIGSILSGVRRITTLPLVAVNAHRHHDHRSGDAGPALYTVDIAVHRAGADAHEPAPERWRADYGVLARHSDERFRRLARFDYETFFH